MDKIKEFAKKYSLIIVGVLALLSGYFSGNIKTFGDLASAIGAIKWSNEAAVETLENNTGGNVAVTDSEGDLIVDPSNDK